MFQEHMSDVLLRAAEHRGATLVEIAQNCVIFNDGAWKHLTDPDKKLDNVLYLEHGKPMRFGQKRLKGIRLNGFRPEVVDVAEVGEENLLVHDEKAEEPTLAYFLSRMGPPDFPAPVGVFRSIDKPVHDQLLLEQIREAEVRESRDMNALYLQGETWVVPQEVK
jgi:2-oxoglutarate ferredoxin oxidoreductase subunit beta